MSFGDILYIIVAFLFSYMTFVIIRNNFRSKFDEEQRRKDLVDDYEDDYISDKAKKE
ncbi:hypothetical protein ACM66Z_03415 [Sulfurovum sp. ST-21]|uniref:CcoQ/FixQ family Cbb3-type cytochrome c oxidase assembly chaperone n=1 Tax=Sulfurovum indicum TaxID=2779528 RepID=A0A7M1S532_9BACT|nr:hypothetical protein [Sulfurovum indicum]QOR62527.1 hypothetical protein IMZ28_03395 [Sulfurovum indicum]